MNLSWLSHYTGPDERLRRVNEERAYAARARWRSWGRALGRLRAGARERRAGARELANLGDALLDDIGARREAGAVTLSRPAPVPRPRATAGRPRDEGRAIARVSERPSSSGSGTCLPRRAA